ncbi:MAG: aminotransferase class I/II-fold pyridoxal phosphate-dependent enzyme [Treponema sp.]|jgi:histidinol-phosphate/aromatic aminotransferase/cobyric acid decarboxylase-like protein/choline kinase|nr:aminotransferase class I/II-fold pyridoxal phosphate-dependent enzyme [Treponema sp.]
MQAVILAAGMGSRLGKYTANNTKCMLPVNGRTLIERALDALDAAGIRSCVIVVGYQKENLMRFVGPRYKNIEIIYISNDVYNKTNNIYSLYLAKDYLLADDTLLLESDLIFEDRIISELLDHPEPTLAVVAPYESWMDGTVVQITPDQVITGFIPRKFFNYQEKESYYKTVNIYKFSREFLQTSYVPFLEAYSRAMGNNEYYEQVLRVITTLDKNELKALVLSDQKWYEIDDVQDKDIAETIFSNTPDETLRLIAKRYGGYWRFPRMIDFCYLVNPYFPTGQMRNEMKAYFNDLLTNYPSGLNVQNLLAGKMFGVDEANILTGNGAAELIRALAPLIQGSIGVIYPTFNEYPESFGGNAVIIPFSPRRIPDAVSYGLADLLDWSGRCDTLVLINPDNPSGNFIPAADILKLLENMRQNKKRLILDESFVDFSDVEESSSLLNQKVLDENPNLVLIKSLSKSYGIPGIRLGVLACGDRSIIKDVRKNIPIWNINSFAEYFLQIIGKYQKDYRAACRSIAGERRRFQAELEKTGLFTVFPSQANYFLCRCAGSFTAEDLAKYLLTNHNIFIKDLTGKKGIPGNTWLRLAVRDREDNDVLISKLMAFKETAAPPKQ